MALAGPPRQVMHLVESAGGGTVMFGKERVVFTLMVAQKARGAVIPRLAAFSPCALADAATAEGISVDVLGDRERTLPLAAIGALRQTLARSGGPLLHTHGYKSNITGRLMRITGARMRGLVATCHGFIDQSPNLRFYNAIDRATSPLSDAVTAPDPRMLRPFPPAAHTRWVPNAIADRPPADASERARARKRFGWSEDAFVIGMLGRLSAEKGAEVFLDAARRSAGIEAIWAAAGSGPLEAALRVTAPPNLHMLGFVSPAEDLLAAIDVYVQPSLTEGLSLSLLEAMRGALPIVATDVGATSVAVADGRDALLVASDAQQIADAVSRLRADATLRDRLGASARQRYFDGFRMEIVERQYADLYAEAAGPMR